LTGGRYSEVVVNTGLTVYIKTSDSTPTMIFPFPLPLVCGLDQIPPTKRVGYSIVLKVLFYIQKNI
jgi:hypothetical protein